MDYAEIQNPVRPSLRAMEAILSRRMGSSIGLIAELERCTAVGKGKQIRAAFFFLLARLVGARQRSLPTQGAALEMLHLSSLVHDDIVDHSRWRRGQKTPNHHFGDTLSVLWGDFLFITSIRMLTRAGCREAVTVMAEASRQMIEGQILEYENNFNYAIRLQDYYAIIRRKTASLFAGIGALAARLAQAPAGRVGDCCRFGRDFGMMFQISDDLLDLFSRKSGKGRFRDLQEGKITLPYILLLRDGGLPLMRNFPRRGPDPLLRRCQETAVHERSLAVMDRYHRRCRRFLLAFPASPARAALLGLLDFIRQREY